MKKKARVFWERAVSVQPFVYEKRPAPNNKKQRIGFVGEQA